MKNKAPLVLFLVIIVALAGLALFLNTKVVSMRQELDMERYNRLTAEEERATAASRIRALETQLEAANKKIEDIQSILNQKESTTQDLQAQLEEAQKNRQQQENETAPGQVQQ